MIRIWVDASRNKAALPPCASRMHRIHTKVVRALNSVVELGDSYRRVDDLKFMSARGAQVECVFSQAGEWIFQLKGHYTRAECRALALALQDVAQNAALDYKVRCSAQC